MIADHDSPANFAFRDWRSTCIQQVGMAMQVTSGTNAMRTASLISSFANSNCGNGRFIDVLSRSGAAVHSVSRIAQQTSNAGDKTSQTSRAQQLGALNANSQLVPESSSCSTPPNRSGSDDAAAAPAPADQKAVGSSETDSKANSPNQSDQTANQLSIFTSIKTLPKAKSAPKSAIVATPTASKIIAGDIDTSPSHLVVIPAGLISTFVSLVPIAPIPESPSTTASPACALNAVSSPVVALPTQVGSPPNASTVDSAQTGRSPLSTTTPLCSADSAARPEVTAGKNSTQILSLPNPAVSAQANTATDTEIGPALPVSLTLANPVTATLSPLFFGTGDGADGSNNSRVGSGSVRSGDPCSPAPVASDQLLRQTSEASTPVITNNPPPDAATVNDPVLQFVIGAAPLSPAVVGSDPPKNPYQALRASSPNNRPTSREDSGKTIPAVRDMAVAAPPGMSVWTQPPDSLQRASSSAMPPVPGTVSNELSAGPWATNTLIVPATAIKSCPEPPLSAKDATAATDPTQENEQHPSQMSVPILPSVAARPITPSNLQAPSVAADPPRDSAANISLVTPGVNPTLTANHEKPNSPAILPPAHQVLDSAPVPPSADSTSAALPTHPAIDGTLQLHVGVHTSAFGNLEIHTIVEQSQVGIAIHGDRDLARWFNSEVGGLTAELKNQHLNLTTIDFAASSGLQTTTTFQQGESNHNFPQTSGSQVPDLSNEDVAAQPENGVPSFLSAESLGTRVSILA